MKMRIVKFKGQPDVLPISEKLYQLDESYYVALIHPSAGEIEVHVPNGFVYDGASVPRVLWSLAGLHPDGLMRAASLVHDYIYIWKGELKPWTKSYKHGCIAWVADTRVSMAVKFTRKQADDLFLLMLKASGMSWSKRNKAYLGVRLGGWVPWKKERRKDLD